MKNTSYGAAQQAIAVIVSILLLPYMIWHMGVDNYGYWLILKLFSIGGYLAVAELGFYGSVLRYLTRFHTEKNSVEFIKLFVSSIFLFLALGAACFIGILIFAGFAFFDIYSIPEGLRGQLYTGLVFYGVVLLVQFPNFAVKAYYLSMNDFFTVKLWESLNTLLFALSIYILMHYSTSIAGVVMTEVVVTCILSVIFLLLPYWAKENYSLSPMYLSIKSVRKISRLTYYTFLTQITSTIYLNTPQLIISLFLMPKYLTFYHVVTRIPRIIKMMQSVVRTVLLPLSVTLDSRNQNEKKKQLYLRSTRYLLMILAPIAIFSIFYSGEIISAWIGEEFYWLGSYQIHFVLWQFFGIFISAGTAMYIKSEQYRMFLPFNIFATALYLAIIGLMVREHKLWAVVYGLYVSQMIIISVNYYVIKKMHNFSLKEYFDTVVKSPVMFGVALCWTQLVIFNSFNSAKEITLLAVYAVLMAAIYGAVVYKFGLVDYEKADIKMLLGRQERTNLIG